MKLRQVLALIGIIMLLFVVICGGFVWMIFKDWGSYDPSAAPLQIAESMLQAIATQTSAPDVTVEPWEVGDKECKDLLQSLMMRNKNQYSLTVARIMGDYGTKVPGTGANEVLLHVNFPDGSRVELYFYITTLEDCHEITD